MPPKEVRNLSAIIAIVALGGTLAGAGIREAIARGGELERLERTVEKVEVHSLEINALKMDRAVSVEMFRRIERAIDELKNEIRNNRH